MHDRRQPRAGIGLQPPAHFQAVHRRHVHVEQDDVRPVSLDRFERGGAVGGGNHIVAVAAQQLTKQRAHALGVVDDEHTAAARDRRQDFIHDACSRGGALRPDAPIPWARGGAIRDARAAGRTPGG